VRCRRLAWGIVAVPFIGLFPASLPTSGQPVLKGVNAHLTMDYYDVTGRNWPEVRADIFRSRPLVPGTNERFEGVTTYMTTLGPQAMVSTGQCSPALTSVDIAVTIKVPRLSGMVRLSDDDQECWALYDRSLTDHEEGHMQLAMRDGQTVLDLLRTAKTTSCADLQAIVDREQRQMSQNQQDYDNVTDHMKMQWRRYGLYDDADDADTRALKSRCFG
jgi:predicted secreted Zn-dependent protease